MVSRRGQPTARSAAGVTASAAGEVTVEEYGYRLGPPDGMLILRYPPARTVADFPESRNDFVHQLFWSPDGLLAVRRGAATAFLGPDRALWVRRGVVAEVAALDVQTVLRVCLRQAPHGLTAPCAAATIAPTAAEALVDVARPGMSETDGVAARAALFTGLVAPTPITHRRDRPGPARLVSGALLRDLADPTGLTAWADRLHVSAKTLQRDFEREYGMSFTAWRTRTRLHASLAMLRHWSVTETAHRVGYATASAYVAAFTREYGESPGRRTERLLRRHL